MASQDIALMAHLMRRAGFGATAKSWKPAPPKGTRLPLRSCSTPKVNRPSTVTS